MRVRKLRGGKRRLKQIRRWADHYLYLDEQFVKEYGRQYVKVYVHPWSGIIINRNSGYPEPNGQAKKLIVSSLLQIYSNWKQQLEALGQPYYLKIWLCEPRLSKSQIVCAIDNYIEFYDGIFYKPERTKSINLNNYSKVGQEMTRFNWGHYLDEEIHLQSDLGARENYETLRDYEVSVKWFSNLLKRPHRTVKFENPFPGDDTESYHFKMGDLWLGEIK